MDDDSSASSQSRLDIQSTKKRGRGCTRMKKLQHKNVDDQRLSTKKIGRGCTRMKKLQHKNVDGQRLPIDFNQFGLPSVRGFTRMKKLQHENVDDQRLSTKKKERGCTKMKNLQHKNVDGQRLPIDFNQFGRPSERGCTRMKKLQHKKIDGQGLSTKKRGRGCTLMKKLQHKNVNGQRLSIDFNQFGLPSGDNAKDFKNHVASIAREKVSILITDWDDVAEEVKNDIWIAITQVWDVPTTDTLKKKTFSYARERWRAFKNTLASRYLNDGYLSHTSPTKTYPFIDEETWQTFAKMREEPSFLEKRKKAQKIQAYNKYPHRLSQGGYLLLEKKMMQEKLKERQESTGELEVAPPSPPQRHEKWKRARLKPSGEYTSEDTRLVAEKIDFLVSQGTFVPQGRNDILAEAIGPEHPGRVRGVGRGVGIRQFFGSHSRYDLTPSIINDEQLASLKVDLTKEIKEQLIQELSSLGFFQQNQNFLNHSPKTTLHTSTRDSCFAVPPIPLVEEDIPEECELYVDGNINVVAYANMYNLGHTIHNQVLNNDMVRVAVTKVLDKNARVPVSTHEVITVGEALNTFIQWPKRLLQLISNKDVVKSKKDDVPSKSSEPICRKLCGKAMDMKETLRVKAEYGGIDYIMISREDIVDLCLGTKELCFTILQAWLTYLYHLCIELGKGDVYGFIDPYLIQSENDQVSVQTFIQNKMHHDQKDCYLVPYLSDHHWQLFIINSKKHEVVFLCSLGRKKPDKTISCVIELALDGYNKLQGVKKKTKTKWIHPTSQRKSANYECGYYVMIHMLNIVSRGVVDSWKQVFGDSKSFHKDEVKNIQERCANMIFQLIEADKDNDMDG